jgi:hypothetical protein
VLLLNFKLWLGNTAQIKLNLGVCVILKGPTLKIIDSILSQYIHLQTISAPKIIRELYILLKFHIKIRIHHQKYLALINALESNYLFFFNILFLKNSQKEFEFI